MTPKIKVVPDMSPNGYAKALGKLSDIKYSLRFNHQDWCRVYSGRNKVWECNGTFARSHFYKSEF